MAQENEKSKSTASGGEKSSATKETGGPGRTPGKAEGDEETVEESLRQRDRREHG